MSTKIPRLRTALGGLAALGLIGLATASSHREAPFVTETPKTDGTDFYMFRSYEPGREDFITLIANYIPLQDPGGGPNYFTMDPFARYEIHVDNDADALEDITFRFQFTNTLTDLQLDVGNPGNTTKVSVPLRNIGPVLAGNETAVNDFENYTLDVVMGSGAGASGPMPVSNLMTGSTTFSKPLDNIGTKSFPDYAAYAASKVYDIALPGGFSGRMFVGQRKESFVVNLGETFDLVNLNPLGPNNAKPNTLEDKNITSLVLEIPKDFLRTPTQPVIGGWTTARLPRRRVLKDDPTYMYPARSVGAFIQVSRLGSPLVNELVIGLPDKNRFNRNRPFDDGQFLDYVTNPVTPELLELLFGVQAPNFFPRDDLVATFLTGLGGLNANGSVGEMLRLNTDIPATPKALQNNLGALGGDLAGFPNGRRPGDDVVDITLRVAMGALLDPVLAPDGQLPYTDGAFIDAMAFDETFPYLTTPIPGAQ